MSPFRVSLVPWLVLGMALGATWLVWTHEQTATRTELRAQFDFSLRDLSSRIEQRMAADEQMLHGIQGLFSSLGVLDRQAFGAYVDSLQLTANFSSVQAVGVVEYVPAAGKAGHQAAMRRQGLPDYAIHPDGEREAYAPIIQRAPYVGLNRIAFGFDPLTDPTRRAAMERARDSGLASLTGRVRLMIERDPNPPPGFVIYLPVYAKGQPTHTLELRRTHLIGWVYASFRMTDFMASLYGEQPPGIAFTLHDGVEPLASELLYRSSQGGDANDPPALAVNEYLVFGGRTWLLSMRTLDDFQARFSRDAAAPIAWGGLGLSLLLGMLAWVMTTGRARALQMAEAMTRELRESERRWAFALEGAGDGVWDWDLASRQAVTSPRWNQIVGCTETCGANTIDDWEALLHPEDRGRVLAELQAYLDGRPDVPATWVVEYRLRCREVPWKWVLSRGMAVTRDPQGRPSRMIGTISDITERKATDERIRHMAQHDALTDLPNRALFSDRLQLAMAYAKRHDERFALIFLDLDNFKPINDNFGHAVGDRLLQQVARRLQEAVRESDTVGRIGGDEFVVLMPRLAQSAAALALAEKLRHALHLPFRIDDRELVISCSLGVAVYPDDGDDEIALFKGADEAMYRAKGIGRDNVVMADSR